MIFLAGDSNQREQNYEVKYLRKTLGQIDKRIQVPQSVSASSLRALLDDIPDVSSRETTRRRPRWLSLQSGIAYAAAFTLIVALFYSMEFYKPEMINGGMKISETEQAAMMVAAIEDIPETQDSPSSQPEMAQIAETQEVTEGDAVFLPEPDSAPETPESAVPAAGAGSTIDNVGGGGKAVLLLEEGEKAYYGRTNDTSDPHRPNPATLEIVDTGSQEIITYVNIPDMREIDRCFVLDDTVMVTGKGDGGVVIRVYSGLDGEGEPVEQFAVEQPGELIDARMYRDIVHIASASDTPAETGETVELPNTSSTDSCVITAIDMVTLETTQKSFVGANGTVQLHNLNAYIRYEGINEDDSHENYIGQIIFDGMDITLGTVS